MPFAQGALRIQIQQLGGGVAHLLHRAALGFVPSAAAQLVQRCAVGRAAAVTADHMKLSNRHVQLVAVRIFQQQKFVLAFAHVEINQPGVARDAVLLMYHGVTGFEFGQIAQHTFHVALFCCARHAAARLRGIQLAFSHNREFGIG